MNIFTMKFFKSYLAERRRKKFYSDLKSRRIADDDILSDEIKEKFDNLLLELNVKGTGDAAIEKATTRFNALKLKPYGKMRNILDLLIIPSVIPSFVSSFAVSFAASFVVFILSSASS